MTDSTDEEAPSLADAYDNPTYKIHDALSTLEDVDQSRLDEHDRAALQIAVDALERTSSAEE